MKYQVYKRDLEKDSLDYIVEFFRDSLSIEVDPKDFKKDKNGKYQAIKDIHFNISHTKNFLAIAAGGKDLGLDIEERDREIDDNLSRRILKQNEEPLENSLLKTWVLKEAYSKMTGEGLKLDFRKISTDEIRGKYQVKDLSDDKLIAYVVFDVE